MLEEATARNTGAKGGTGSGPPDLQDSINKAIERDALPDTVDWGEAADEPTPVLPKTTVSGVTDDSWGDKRVPSEVNWAADALSRFFGPEEERKE